MQTKWCPDFIFSKAGGSHPCIPVRYSIAADLCCIHSLCNHIIAGFQGILFQGFAGHNSRANSPAVLRWLWDSPRTGCVWRTTPYIYVALTSNNRVILACELHRSLLPQCEALRICRLVSPIATVSSQCVRPCKIIFEACTCNIRCILCQGCRIKYNTFHQYKIQLFKQ